MEKPRTTSVRVFAVRSLAALSIGTLILAGCAVAPDRGGETATEAEAEPAANVQTYSVAGEVVYLPSESVPALTLRHQAIDDFVDMDGEVVGMQSMTMPFPVADGVSLAGIEKGDQVRFTLEVEWEGDPPYRIAHIERVEPPAD